MHQNLINNRVTEAVERQAATLERVEALLSAILAAFRGDGPAVEAGRETKVA